MIKMYLAEVLTSPRHSTFPIWLHHALQRTRSSPSRPFDNDVGVTTTLCPQSGDNVDAHWGHAHTLPGGVRDMGAIAVGFGFHLLLWLQRWRRRDNPAFDWRGLEFDPFRLIDVEVQRNGKSEFSGSAFD